MKVVKAEAGRAGGSFTLFYSCHCPVSTLRVRYEISQAVTTTLEERVRPRRWSVVILVRLHDRLSLTLGRQ